MPVATAPARAGRVPVPTRALPPNRPPLRLVEPPRRRLPRRSLRRTWVVSVVVVVGSLLMVAGANAYLTQGQVRLTRLQQQVSTAISRYRNLEQTVAQLADPSHIVSEAQQHGLQAPSQVTDLPLVITTAPVTSTTSPPAPRASSAVSAEPPATTPASLRPRPVTPSGRPAVGGR